MRRRAPILGLLAGLLLAAVFASAASAYTRPEVAALQVALRSAGLYSGTVDGVAGSGTAAAVRAVQQRAGLPADGLAGPSTLRTLGRLGEPRYGSRAIVSGAIGWDVAALQFSLAAHGFPSGPVDGGFGPRSAAALQRFQQWAGISPDGLAGPSTLRALSAPPAASPVKLRAPVQAPVGDRFGPRFNVFHAGLDFPANAGAPVTAAGFGTVVTAGYDASGWGNMVVIGHRFGLRTLYAHLATIAVSRGQSVGVGRLIGTVGSSGRSTGPHLHFELQLRGANIDPLGAL
jgi:murein DD-endopeptidase MepM/ murein hydrolase activator NlpD